MIHQAWRTPLLSTILCSLLAGCSVVTKETVPTPEVIRKMMEPFLIEAGEINGEYRNLDVDSLVFTYRTAVQTESEFCGALSSALLGSKWERSIEVTDSIEFRRSVKKGDALFASYELVRIGFCPADRTVVVAYVQADSPSDDLQFEDTGESKWAEQVIWPRFNALRNK